MEEIVPTNFRTAQNTDIQKTSLLTSRKLFRTPCLELMFEILMWPNKGTIVCLGGFSNPLLAIVSRDLCYPIPGDVKIR